MMDTYAAGSDDVRYFPQPVEESRLTGFCEIAESTTKRLRRAFRGIGARPLSSGVPSG